MIALVGALAAGRVAPGTVLLNDMPEVPAHGFAGVIVRADSPSEVESVLSWYVAVRAARPGFPLGLASRPEACAAPLGAFRDPVKPVMDSGDIEKRGLDPAMLEAFRGSCVEGLILQDLVRHHGHRLLRDQRLLEALIAHASAGRTLRSAARALGVSEDTIHRRLDRLSIPVGRLMSLIRLHAYDLRIELGSDPDLALEAGRWSSQKARQRMARRIRSVGLALFGRT